MDAIPLAIVTGAARRLGKLFAVTLAQRGYAILLHYNHSGVEAVKTADEIRALGVPAYLAQADLEDENQILSLLSVLEPLPHQLKVLVNSASVMQRTKLRTMSPEDWDSTFALNLRAPFLLAQKAAERMTTGGLIVNISDVGAEKLWTGYTAYVVSKSALETLTRLFAKTYAPGIRVNAIAPGLVLQAENVTREEWNDLIERLPIKHPVQPSDVAAALTFLLDNPSITGQIIAVDGGYSLV